MTPMNAISAELALGLWLALESSGLEIDQARGLLRGRSRQCDACERAERVLERVRARIENARRALGPE